MKKLHKILMLPLLTAALAYGSSSVVHAAPSTARAAVNELIAAPHSALPAGTIVRDISVSNGLATVNFSRQFQQNFHGGDTEEAAAVNAILVKLGKFSSINRVQILLEGRKIESLGGLLIISDPLQVIRPSNPDLRMASRID